jgi:hypothetical protein
MRARSLTAGRGETPESTQGSGRVMAESTLVLPRRTAGTTPDRMPEKAPMQEMGATEKRPPTQGSAMVAPRPMQERMRVSVMEASRPMRDRTRGQPTPEDPATQVRAATAEWTRVCRRTPVRRSPYPTRLRA